MQNFRPIEKVKIRTQKLDNLRFMCPNNNCLEKRISYYELDKHLQTKCPERETKCSNDTCPKKFKAKE